MLKFKLKTLLWAVAASAVVCFIIRQVFVVPNIAAERHIRMSPIQTKINLHPGGEASSNRISYSVGQYGVSEFGNIRLAIRGGTFRGKSASGVSLSNNMTSAGLGGGSSTRGNDHEFSAYAIAGGSTCTFNGISFQIVKGKLALSGKELDAVGPPCVVIVDRQGRIEAVEKITEAKMPVK